MTTNTLPVSTGTIIRMDALLAERFAEQITPHLKRRVAQVQGKPEERTRFVVWTWTGHRKSWTMYGTLRIKPGQDPEREARAHFDLDPAQEIYVAYWKDVDGRVLDAAKQADDYRHRWADKYRQADALGIDRLRASTSCVGDFLDDWYERVPVPEWPAVTAMASEVFRYYESWVTYGIPVDPKEVHWVPQQVTLWAKLNEGKFNEAPQAVRARLLASRKVLFG